jgi:hydrophobic/amphiphilic exporter-1 (mainly G- bacteria), HAE1 family
VSLSSRSIRRPIAVTMLFVAVILLGMISFSRLPIDLLPDVSYPQLVVYTTYPGAAPAEVERFVTEPVERAVATVPGVQRLESTTREGVSLVTIRFAWGADMDFAALNVRERLDALRDVIPEMASRPSVLRTDPQADPVMALSVAGPGDPRELRELTEAVFKRRLEQIDGVAQAVLTGGVEREIRVEVDPGRLESLGVSMEEVRSALDAANASAPGGTILRGRSRYALRTLGEFQTVAEISRVPVRSGDREGADGEGIASFVTVGDIAHVEDGVRERESIARYDGREAVGLLVFKAAGTNTVRVADRVHGVLEELRAEFPAVDLEVATSQAGFISESISNVVQALLWGGILAFLVLFLFLRDPRYPVAIAIAIPISVVGTFSLLDLFGVSLNIMSLGGLALGVGMLVDNSIVVLENIFRHREEGKAPSLAAAAGAEEVQGAITASTLTTISVFGPIIYIEGVAGELFGALSLAVAFSLLTSLLVALTLLPMMAARWGEEGEHRPGWIGRTVRRAGRGMGTALGRLTRRPLDAFDRLYDRLAGRYHGLLGRALERRGRVLGIAGGLLVAAVAVGILLPRSVLPEVDQGAFSVRIELDRGTPLEETSRVAARLEDHLRADAAVAAVFTRVGRQEAAGGVEMRESGLHTGTVDVRLVDGAATAPVVRRLRESMEAEIRAGALSVETGQATALGTLLGGADADIAVRIRGDDEEAVLAYANAVTGRLRAEGRLTNVRLGAELGQPEYRVEIDRERAAAYGIEPARIARAVETYMRGETATEFVDFDRRVPIVVRLPEADRQRLETLDRLTVEGVPLRELVRTEAALGPAEILRIEQGRILPVYADVASGGVAAGIAAARSAIADLETPAGVRTEIGGENEEMHRAFRDLAFAFGLALLLVFMILAAQFESLFHPFTILLAVPLAIVGAVAALGITGSGLNTMSLIGVVILVGIVVNDSIIKVDLINQLRARGHERRRAVMEAGMARLHPILMTTVTTVIALLPMAMGIGRGADLRAPLAIAVIGGLAVATLLTLIVIPVVYEMVDDVRLRVRGLFAGDEEVDADGLAPAPVAGD